jgi:replicative DNA helicase
MQANTNRRNENRVQEVSEISRNLKELAREMDVPVMSLSQLSRSVEGRQSKVPQLSDLRESGCLTGETLIYLPDEDVYKRLDSLIGQAGFSVLALNEATWKLEPRKVVATFSTGHKQVYTLTTRSGRTIKATSNHKFLTIDGWRALENLTPKTHIALPRTIIGPTKDEMDYAYCDTGLYKNHIGRERAARVASVVQSRQLSLLAESDVYWDEVISIKPEGEEEVYDLTVDEHHNFVANNIIVHNSLEQDADIVMFIYRDDVYNQESEQKNIANIIVAKHRNGPVGEVSLYFQASQTRFRDLEVTPTEE